MSQASEKHHAAIFRASIFTGGSQVISALVGFVRGKSIALALGVAGVGVNGLMIQASGLVQTIFGLGISSSGVRTIAQALGKSDKHSLGRAYKAVRIWSWVTGALAGLTCIALSGFLSQLTFDSPEYALDFKLLGVAVFLQQLAQGQSAVLRGIGAAKDLAVLSVISSVTGLVISVPCFFYLGMRGIAPAIVLVSVAGLACSWWYVRRHRFAAVQMTLPDLWQEGSSLIHLGSALVGTAVATMAANYITGQVIRSHLGVEGNGFYQAAASLTIGLAGFVLTAMGHDYYPRLIAIIGEKEKSRKLVHDQSEMALLMAAPILVTVAAAAPWLLSLAFSEKFIPASSIVVWLSLGCLARVLAWPLGLALLAEGSPLRILAYECSTSALAVALAWIGVRLAGLDGAGAAFACLNLLYWMALYALIRRRLGFVISTNLLINVFLVAIVITTNFWLGPIPGLILSTLTALVCSRSVFRHLGPSHRVFKMAVRVPGLAWVLGLRRECG